MSHSLRRRFLVLFVLAVLGVGLAVVGSSFGVDRTVTATDTSGQFTVSEDGVTFSDGDQEITAVENMSGVTRIDVTDENGAVNVRTVRNDSLGENERERAKMVARSNETVQQYVQRVEEYEIVVEPIRQIDAASVQQETLNKTSLDNETIEDASGNGNFTFSVAEDELDSGDDSVTVTREYADKEVNVRVTGPNGDLQFSLVVDLSTETVVRFTDWGTVGDE